MDISASIHTCIVPMLYQDGVWNPLQAGSAGEPCLQPAAQPRHDDVNHQPGLHPPWLPRPCRPLQAAAHNTTSGRKYWYMTGSVAESVLFKPAQAL